MVPWWAPYLPKGCWPEFNNSLGCDLNSGPVLGPGDYLSPTRIMAPGHSSLVSDEVYVCSSLLLMISWWLPYLAKGPTPDFNNGPGNDFIVT